MIAKTVPIISSGKNILITGANSGIGFFSVINFLRKKNYLFIPLKSISRKEDFIKKLKNYFNIDYINTYIKIIDNVDFSDLKNLEKIKEYLSRENINLDIIILNAGLQYTGSLYPKVSKQGVELTFAVNHLAHFYLINIVLPFLKDYEGSKIIITSSDVHDPNSSGGNIGKKANLNNLKDFKEEIMGNYLGFNADKAYKNSKLCNILFGKELSNRLQIRKSKIAVISWAPGLVIPNDGNGFFRYSKKFNQFGYFLFSKLAKDILGISESVEDAGKLLFEIAIDDDLNQIKYIHLSNKLVNFRKHKLVESNVSKEANNKQLATRLWQLSEELCSLFLSSTTNV